MRRCIGVLMEGVLKHLEDTLEGVLEGVLEDGCGPSPPHAGPREGCDWAAGTEYAF